MLIVVSPAKTLDYESPLVTEQYTLPELTEHSQQLIEVCRELTPMDIARLMKVSDKIAGLNAARFAEWGPLHLRLKMLDLQCLPLKVMCIQVLLLKR